MTIYQWAWLVIFIMLFYYANRKPKETDMGLPDCAEEFYTHLCPIPLRLFCCVYSVWYAFHQVPFFWNAMMSMEEDAFSQFLLIAFYFVCVFVIPAATTANITYSLFYLFGTLEEFKSCYKATRGILENGYFSRALFQIRHDNAFAKYISLKTFLKVKDVISVFVDGEYCIFFYRTHNHKEIFLSCSPITYLVILLCVVKQKEKEQKEKDKLNSKKKKKKRVLDDSELLEIFIEDLQKRKEENERKASQYFNQAKETFEQVKNNS